MKHQDRERAIVEVVGRVVEATRLAAQAGGPSVEDVLADTLYHEQQRLEKSRGNGDDKEYRRFYRNMRNALPRASVSEQVRTDP